ncbi:hypothetical protein PG995_004516 [Apiospora arundinis]
MNQALSRGGDGLDGAIRSLTLLLSDMKSPGLPLAVVRTGFSIGRLHEALQKVDELHHCARAADPTYTRILNHENVVLRKQLLAIETAREDSGLIRTGSLGPSKKDIDANLEVIEDLIADECASLSLFGRVLDQPKEIMNSVLSQLTRTLCGLDFESFVAYCKKYRIDMAIVLRSLVAAALWVLVWRHPLEEIIAEESPILRHYKIQADNPDGPHALHKVELLAYNSLVSESHFDTQFVAGHTESVLGYMCHILEPLLDSESNQLGSNELKTSDSALLDLFLDVTTRTIELAAKLCLTDRRCIWRFFQPGSIFDPQTMKLVEWTTFGTSHREKEAPSGDVKTVQLCIFPTFYMSKIPGSRASPGGNGHTATSASDDLGEFQLVAKGLVLIQ